MTHSEIKEQLRFLGNPERAEHSKYFFKTGPGQYAEGDKFFGCTVPEVRIIAKENKQTPLAELSKLLEDEMHECRLCALIILVAQFQKTKSEDTRGEIIDFYLSHTHRINNWDLVDNSCYKILGEWLKNKNRDILYTLADSGSLWNERIAVVSTIAFIKQDDFKEILHFAEKFLTHKHDLMHKACGWMLREMGQRDELSLTDFLDKHATKMPRTMLRYSIEKLSDEQRKHYMRK